MDSRAKTLRIVDEVLEKILYETAQTCPGSLVLQGGGAMHFLYASPRYSDDLDFVNPNLTKDKAAINEAFSKPITALGYVFTPTVTKDNDDFMRIAYRTHVPNIPVPKVEIQRTSAQEITTAQGKFAPLLVETPQEIFTDKMKATLSRMQHTNGIKPTDLYDLQYLAQNFSVVVDKKDILFKCAQYDFTLAPNTALTTATYIENTANQDRFSTHIRRTLLPDVQEHVQLTESFYKKAASQFRELARQLES